jgi:hypothetical protein
MHHIDGIDRDQITMFPEALDDQISEDNPVRIVNTFVGRLDLSSCQSEKKNPEKPDGLRFVRGAEIQSSRARLTPHRLRCGTV